MRGASNRKAVRSEAGAGTAALPTIETREAKGRLLPHVESYYLFRCEAAELDAVERVDLGQIRFLIRGEGTMTFPDGHSEEMKPIMVAGPGSAAASYTMRGPVL